MKINSIYRYPLKGFSAERLARAELKAGRVIDGDRRFVLRHAASKFDPAAPTWQRKAEFVVLAHGSAPATVETRFEAATGVMTVAQKNGHQLFVGNVMTDAGRRGASFVLSQVVKDGRGAVELIDAGALAMTDIQTPALSLINLASVKALSDKVGIALDPMRFRGNILIEDAAPWAEFELVGKSLRLGGATGRVMKRIDRCAATSVDPATATKDINVVAMLQQHFSHIDCGIYIEITGAGTIKAGDAITVA
ncbi:MAG: MOSC domain-containing protein [Alphaproteobacteria bacterium]|nr:MOSC domain-containing protein [Alphaproteobacteria bacterium]